MQEESDGTLLYYMSCRDSPADRAVSDAAAREFHRRHMAGLLARCRRLCQSAKFGNDFASDLAMVTLAKAVQRAGTFVDVADASAPQQRTQSWLGKIARNMLADTLRNPNRPGPLTGVKDEIPFEDYSHDEIAAFLCDGRTFARDTETIRLVAEALAKLDERSRAVLVQTTLQRQRSPKGSYMFRGSAEALAQRFGTTTVNIRRIRMNAVRSISAYLRTQRKG